MEKHSYPGNIFKRAFTPKLLFSLVSLQLSLHSWPHPVNSEHLAISSPFPCKLLEILLFRSFVLRGGGVHPFAFCFSHFLFLFSEVPKNSFLSINIDVGSAQGNCLSFYLKNDELQSGLNRLANVVADLRRHVTQLLQGTWQHPTPPFPPPSKEKRRKKGRRRAITDAPRLERTIISKL